MEKDSDVSLIKAIKERPLVDTRNPDEKILVLGAKGQVAQYLLPELQKYYPANLLLTDLHADPEKHIESLDITNARQVKECIRRRGVKVVINLAALLSGAAAEDPDLARKINVRGPFNVLEAGGKINPRTGMPYVRKVFTPSSIAVMGEESMVEGVAPLHAATYPTSTYGKAKHILEALSDFYSSTAPARDAKPIQASCLRYGGVLTCQVDPSNGTTEELDKLIVAAAEYAVYGDAAKRTLNGVYMPEISLNLKFPMLDGDTVGRETMRFLHADPADIKGKEAHYHLQEYSVSLRDVADILHDRVPGLRVRQPEGEEINGNKEQFAREWPKQLDMQPSRDDWGFAPKYDACHSVLKHFDRLVEHFKAEKLAAKGVRASSGKAEHGFF